MADVKINYQTGDIAVPQPAGGFRIYKKSEYRFNRETNQFALPADAGGWQIQDAPADAVQQGPGGIIPQVRLPTGENEWDINAGITGSIIRGLKGPGDAYMGNIPPEQMESRATETAMLAAGGPGLIRRAPSTVPVHMPVRGSVKPPTIEALKAEANASYTAARGAGVEFNAPHVQGMADDLLTTFRRDGFVDKNHPTIVNAIDRLRDAQNGVIGFNDLVGVRDALTAEAGNYTNPTSQLWATRAIKSLDDYLENPRPGSVASGVEALPDSFPGFGNVDESVPGGAPAGVAEARAAKAGEDFADANANYGAAKRSEALAGKQERALDRAGATNSGQNLDNQLRGRIDEILARPKEGRGFTDEEMAFLREIVRGSHGENAARYIGNLLGGGGGIGAFLTGMMSGQATGSSIPPMIGAAVPTVGWAAKKLSAGLTGRKISLIDALTRKRSPLHEKNQRNAPRVPAGDARREALLRALIEFDSSQPWLKEQPQTIPDGVI